MGRIPGLLIVILLPVLISFNNCSRSSGDTFGSESSESFLPEASGIITRGDFGFYQPSPNCPEEQGQPAAILNIDTIDGSSELLERGCASAREFDLDYDAVSFNPYNSYFVYYGDHIYASSYLNQGVEGHSYYKEFCFNDQRQLSFTVQYIETVVPGMVQPLKQFIGITMRGEGSDLPGLQFNGGYFEVMNDGSKHFVAMNGAFNFYLERAGHRGLKKAIYQRGEDSITMTCWYHKPE